LRLRKEIEFFLQFAAEPKPRIVDVQFKRANLKKHAEVFEAPFEKRDLSGFAAAPWRTATTGWRWSASRMFSLGRR
jgi:hypothetical protein